MPETTKERLDPERIEGVMWVKFVLDGTVLYGRHIFQCPRQPRDVFLQRGENEWKAKSFDWRDGFLYVDVDQPMPCPACGR